MAAATLLNSNGKVPIQYLDLTGETGFVTNPLTADLQCTNLGSNFNLVDAGTVSATAVQTDNLGLVPGSLQTGITVSDTLDVQDTKAIRFAQDVSITGLGSNRVIAQTTQIGTLDEAYNYANGQMVYTPFLGTLQINNPLQAIPVGAGLNVHGTIIADGIPIASVPNANVLGYNPATGDIEYQPAGGGGGGVTNPMSANLQSGNFDIEMAQGAITFSHPSTAPAPNDWSINGVYNIDTGTLPYPVMRFSSAKAGGTQQKSLTLEMSDGKAIWSSQWEGYIPQEIETRQSGLTIAGQGMGAFTAIQSDTVTITPNFASATAMSLTGSMTVNGGVVNVAVPPSSGNELTNKTYVDGRTQKTTNAFFVAKNGSDSTGDGSIGKPYLTIQTAITAAEAGATPSATNPCVIYVAPGRYTEAITLTDGYTTIAGVSASGGIMTGTTIIGSITINATGANDLFGRIFAFQGLTVIKSGAGSAVEDTTATTEHTVTFTNCKIAADDRAVYLHAGGETRNIFLNTPIQHETGSALYTNPLFEIGGTSSWLEMSRCDLTCQNTQSDCLTFSGTSYPYRLSLSTFTSTSASATANPIVRYATTQTAIGSIGQCAFVYSSATNKSGNQPTSTGILFDTGAFVYPATPVLQILQNVFVLNGLVATGLLCIAKSAGVGTPIIGSYANGTAPTLASKIQGGGAIAHLTYNTLS